MKTNTLISFVAIIGIFTSNVLAQVPEAIKYQAVVRDAEGEILKNQTVSFEIDILTGDPSSGSIIYTETHVDTTDDFGVSNLQIGQGNVLSGNFSSISWADNDHYMRIALDPEGGSSYQVMGTSELLSVPYALQAKEAAVLDGNQPGDFADAVHDHPELADAEHSHTGSAKAFGRISDLDVNTDYCYNVESVTWNADLERYEINIRDHYFNSNDAASVSITGDTGSCPAGAIARTAFISGDLLVYIINSSGDNIECSFRFAAFIQE